MNLKTAIFITPALLCFQMLLADAPEIKVTPAGFVYYQIGQLVKTCDPEGKSTGRRDKAMDQLANFRITLDAVVQNRLRIIAGTEFGFVTRSHDGDGGGNSVKTGVSLKEAQGIYTFGDDQKKPPLQIAVGFFPFKYNPQATNMGEYLFSYRTGAYAPYIVNDFDNCKSRLLGLRVSSVLSDLPLIGVGTIRQDLLFTSEMAVGTGNSPEGDYSLAYLLSCKFKNILDVGSGIYFHRLIPLDKTQTTPRDFIVLDKNLVPVVKNGDTVRLTMKATKLMARFSVDPKTLLPDAMASICGKHDWTIYAETAILGIKNYNGHTQNDTIPFYEDIKKRWPVMCGFYFPAFRLLDFISCEFEYFDWDFDLSIPPNPSPNMEQNEFSNQQKFRWSVFMQKTVTKGFCIRGLVGKDHFRTIDAGGGVTKDEFLRGNGNWHYNLRFMFEF